MTDGKKDQLKRKKTLEYELRRLYRAGELTEQQIAELKEAEFPFDTPVRRTAKSVVRIDDGKKWPSCSAAEKELGITQGWMSDVCNMAQNGKWVAIKNQFYCFESMYSPDMDLTEIRGLAGWIVILETGEMFDTLSDLLDLLEREHECCAYDRPCHMYDLQRAIEGGWEYKGFHFEYMVPPSVSGER